MCVYIACVCVYLYMFDCLIHITVQMQSVCSYVYMYISICRYKMFFFFEDYIIF